MEFVDWILRGTGLVSLIYFVLRLLQKSLDERILMKSGDKSCMLELLRQPKTGGSPRDEKYNRNLRRHANTS